MSSPDVQTQTHESQLGLIARAELFIGRVVVGAAIGEGIYHAANHFGPDLIHTDPTTAASASVALGLLHAIKKL